MTLLEKLLLLTVAILVTAVLVTVTITTIRTLRAKRRADKVHQAINRIR